MRTSRQLRAGCIIAAAVVVLSLNPTPGFAAPVTAAASGVVLSAEESQEVRSSLDKFGVDRSTQDKLMEKLSAGVMWDSFRPDAKPVSTDVVQHESEVLSISRFNDGSVIARSTPGVPRTSSAGNGAAPASVSDCRFTSAAPYGYYWNNCRFYVNLVLIMMGFYANYQVVVYTGAAITNYWGHHFRCVGCTMSEHSLERWSTTQVRYWATCSIAWNGSPATNRCWMQANIDGSGGAWTTNN